MFNFDFKRSDIYLALRWEPFFNLCRIIKKVFAALSIIFFLLFCYGFFSSNLSFSSSKALLGLFMVSFSVYIAAAIKYAFFEIKLKNPEVKTAVRELLACPDKHNLADFLSFYSAKAINRALDINREMELSSTHLFYALLSENKNSLNFILPRLLLNKEDIKNSVKKYIKTFPSMRKEPVLGESFKNTMIEAVKAAERKKHIKIEEGDIISALSLADPVFKRILVEFDLRTDDIENLSLWLENIEKEEKENKRFWEEKNLAKKGSLAKAWTSGYTVVLDRYSTDWTEILRRKPMGIIGHEEQIEMAERILSGGGVNNVLLIGEPGVGKRRIVYALAQKSSLGESLVEINYKRVVELDLPSLLAEIQDKEKLEALIDEIFREAVSAGNVILIIDDFYNYVGTDTDISAMIAPYLKMPQCQLIAITTYEGLHNNIERNSSLLNLFEKVEVPELTREETFLLLETLVYDLEKKHKKIISYPALRQIVDLSERYMPNSAFPEKAIKVLEDTIAYASNSIVLPSDVAKVIAEKTEAPVGEIESKEREVLLNLEALIHNRIINQSEAVKEVSEAMRRARSEVTIRKGPIGAFIFLGPTGVGKTETSKALAEVYFGNEEKMLRFDMSEFQSENDIPRLIGASGLLTTAVRENPFSVLLLDEIEKADLRVRNLFLQVLDEGYITDSLGKKADFRNTIIIATSNAGYKIILEALKENTPWPETKKKLVDFLFKEGIFQPEFLNRFDAVVLFHPLTEENIFDIAGLMLKKLEKNLKEKGIELIVNEDLKRTVARLGYNEVFGAREMRRVIQEKVENVLASALISKKIKRGDKVEINPVNFDLIITHF